MEESPYRAFRHTVNIAECLQFISLTSYLSVDLLLL
jgi:hypothetical protein